ncbi:MAG: hypothetical protein ACJ8C4_11660 [Gemmataceae bacterium]
MRFALLGDHGDGRAFAEALRASGRHEVVDCANRDLEEVLADPRIEACIVAVPVANRLDVARRVLQSERPAAVVHPVDYKPDGAFELNLLQGDVHQALVPLIVEALHPRFDELRKHVLRPPDPARWIDAHFTAPGEALLAIDERRRHPVFPGWTLLRRLNGEIAEVSTFARGEQVAVGEPVVMSGTFADGTLFRASYRAEGNERRAAIAIGASEPEVFAEDDPLWTKAWAKVVAEFEAELAYLATAPRVEPGAGARERPGALLSWRDAVRALELDDAAGRSLAKRRSTLLEYQDASEEIGFKGTMTLLGCGLLWFLLALLIAAAVYPPLFWVTLPILGLFLGLQLLRWILPSRT